MKNWYYEKDGSQEGPVDSDTLQTLIDEGIVSRNTHVWTEGMQSWEPAEKVEEFLIFMPPALVSPPALSPSPARRTSVDPHGGQRRSVESNMTKSVLVTLFCCLPFGIAAIVNASKVSGAVAMGDYAEAERLASKANEWANISLWIGIVFGVLGFFIGLAGG